MRPEHDHIYCENCGECISCEGEFPCHLSADGQHQPPPAANATARVVGAAEAFGSDDVERSDGLILGGNRNAMR